MDQVTRIGMDTSKRIFQLHGVDEKERVILRRKLLRADMVRYFERLPPTLIAIEACGSSHHWARELGKLGHEVRLIAPQLAKPYVKRGKNDAADAEALCEAASRPSMRYVPVKSADQQASLMLSGVRDRLVRNRTQLANAIRGMAAEFGLIAAKGIRHVLPLLDRIAADAAVPALARELFAGQGDEYAALEARIAQADAQLQAWYRSNPMAKKLTSIPGVGAVIASLVVMKTPDPHAFQSGRHFAAWLGLTPKDHSTAGKVRLGGITRAGDETLRSLLVVGATSVISHLRRKPQPGARPWLEKLLERKSPKLVAIALANKTARIIWKLMTSDAAYDPTHPSPACRPALAA